MAPGKIVLLTIVGLLIGAWLAAAIVIFAKALREPGGTLLAIGDKAAPLARRIGFAVRRAPLVLPLSAGLVLNALVFVAALCWYRVQGKPLPPAPATTRCKDR